MAKPGFGKSIEIGPNKELLVDDQVLQGPNGVLEPVKDKKTPKKRITLMKYNFFPDEGGAQSIMPPDTRDEEKFLKDHHIA